MISSAPDPLDRAATPAHVDVVLDAIGVPDTARAQVRAIAARTPGEVEWRRFLASALLLLGPSLAIVVSPDWRSPLGPVSVVALTFLVVATGLFYRLARPDTFMLTAAAGTVMTLLTTIMGRLLIVRLDLGILGLFMMTGVIILEVTLVVSWLRQRAREDTA